MMTIPITNHSTHCLNPTVQIPPSNYHADPTAKNHFTNDDIDFDDNSFTCDQFRMYEYKIRKCTRVRPHEWTECPFSHPGEKARRRDPRKFQYSGEPCPGFRDGGCCKGDACENAHGVFECWLHPARYRTQVCKDGVNCRRVVCFFAHTPDQLRVVSESELPSRVIYDSPKWETLRGSHVGRMCFSLPGRGSEASFSLPRSPVQTRPVFVSLPNTPTGRVTTSGLGVFELWDQSCEEELPMERVESGRELRAKMYAKLSEENSFDSCGLDPDVGWVPQLLE